MNNVCCVKVWTGQFRSHNCGKPAKFEVGGNHFCGIHNPNKAKTKAQIEAEETRKIQAKKYKLERAAPDLLEALKWFVENDDTNIGQEGNEFWEDGLNRGIAAIAKATGEPI